MGSFHLFVHPNWATITFGKTCFCPTFDPFSVPKRPMFKAFGESPRAENGPKTLFRASQMAQDQFLNNLFLTHF